MKFIFNKETILHAETVVSAVALILVPVTFFPLFYDAYNLPKQLILAVFSLILFFLFLLRSVIEKKISITFTPISLVLGVFVLLHVVAIFIKENNMLQGFTNSFGLLTMVPIFILHFCIGNLSKKAVPAMYFRVMGITGIVFSFLTVFWYLGLNAQLPGVLMKQKFFSPTGTIFITFCLLIFCFAITAAYLFTIFREKKNRNDLPLYGSAIMIMGITIVILGYQLMTIAKPLFMPYQLGWTVALNALQANPILGVGVSNYEHAYVATRPAGINLTPFWNIRFLAGSNVFFHYITTLGLLGGTTLLLLGYFVGIALLHVSLGVAVGTVIIGIITILFSPNITLLFYLFSWTALLRYRQKEISIPLPEQKKMSFILFIFPVALLFLFGTTAIPMVLAEYNMHAALAALDQGKLQDSYDFVHKAIAFVPYRSDYAMISSRLTFTVGSAFLQQKDATEEQKKQGILLIDQSINEAKAAIQASPQNSSAWNNLALIYQSLVKTSEEADSWALATLSEALKRDPANPLIRSDMATLMDFQGNTDQAVFGLETVVTMKPDFLQARYALASGYAKQKKFGEARVQLEAILQALPPNSEDATKIKDDLESITNIIDQLKKQQDAQNMATQSAVFSPTPSQIPMDKKTPQLLPTPWVSRAATPSPVLAP